MPRIDRWTIIGIALLLMPLLTMLHEIGGHALTCLATGHHVLQLGAFYVECDSLRGSTAMRLVAFAGPGIDIVFALLGWLVWRRLRGDLARLIGWYVWLGCGFAAAGYFCYSGVTGIGDLGPAGDGGLAPLPMPWLWRAGFALGGGIVYYLLVMAGMRQLAAMIGQGPETKSARRWIAHGYYLTLCVAAVLASLPNPVGIFITLASATAASFGGNTGLISIGYATGEAGEGRGFAIERSWGLLAAGVVASIAFAVVLGPTIRFA
jgi:hypothetical protein